MLQPYEDPHTQLVPWSTTARLARSRRRALALQNTQLARVAGVVAEGAVAETKASEVAHVGRECMTNQAMLSRWRDTLAGGDPLLHDDLNYFSQIVKLGQGEVLSDLVSTYCRESRGVR
jgi:hypothetical protein